MSKSAMYAGLGQGLMALGQGASDALRQTAIAELRKQNFEDNWRMKTEESERDRQFRRELSQEDRALSRDTSQNQQQYNQDLLSLRKEQVGNESVNSSADRLSTRMVMLENKYDSQIAALREFPSPENETKINSLMGEYFAQKEQILRSVPVNIINAAGYAGDYEEFEAAAKNKSAPGQTGVSTTQQSNEPAQSGQNSNGGLYWPHEALYDGAVEYAPAFAESVTKNAEKFKPKDKQYEFKAWKGF